jgi:hypothetical protein
MMYKYSYYLESAGLPRIPNSSFPYLEVGAFSIASTLYLLPYYRLAVPKLLYDKKYWILSGVTILHFLFLTPFNNAAVAWFFDQATEGRTVNLFFKEMLSRRYLDFNLIMTDFIAFFGLALSRFSFQSEEKRHQIEKDNLQLQLSMLKTQLQPHFLFNTLNSLYGMSLKGSADTSRFILLLSQMMQYILYDCEQERVSLKAEADFLTGYFELEQKKYPQAQIDFVLPEVLGDLHLPPLLFLPLVENAFKHGRHKLADDAGVTAELQLNGKSLLFRICNDMLGKPPEVLGNKRGGIGLVNIRKRLDLYYPGAYNLEISDDGREYAVELNIKL